MPVLSIIACRIFEDELSYVLSGDNGLAQLILVENGEYLRLQRKLKSQGCIPTLIPLDRVQEIIKEEHNQLPVILKPLSGIRFIEKIRSKMEKRHKTKVTVVVNVLKMGLHLDAKMLKAEVFRNIREMSTFSNRILIFYGTCGHSLINIEKDFEGLECQLYFLKDDKGEIVEDCISVALGGNDAYVRAMAGNEGTFYLTPMWAACFFEEFPKEIIMGIPENDKKYIKRLKRVAKVNTGLLYEPDFDANVRNFAQFFNMKIKEIQGSKKIAEQSYQNAREFSR